MQEIPAAPPNVLRVANQLLTPTTRPRPRSHRILRAALAVGVLLAITPIRTQQVTAWEMNNQGLTTYQTTALWCSSGSLASVVFGRPATPDVQTPRALQQLVNSDRCRKAGEPIRLAAIGFLLVGLVPLRRRRQEDTDHR